MACGRLSGPVRTWSRALASGAAREVFEIQRVFARADVFATRSGALRAALSDLCIKTSNGPAKVDISALFTRRAGDATFLAVDPSAGTPIEVPHPSADGPLELVGAWVSRFHDAAHAASAARVVRASAHVQRCFDEAPLAQLARIERVLMVRVPSAMPMPSVELHTGKLYEVRSYTINGFDEDGGSDAAAYSAWLERVVVPSIGEAGGRISGFWMRAPGPVQVTVGGSAAKGPVNPADRVADIFWVSGARRPRRLQHISR